MPYNTYEKWRANYEKNKKNGVLKRRRHSDYVRHRGERLWTSGNVAKERYRVWRTAALMLLGGRCEECGFNDMRALNIDHVHGDGHEHRKTTSSAANYMQDISRQYQSGRFQILCANHNQIKRSVRQENGTGTPKGKIQP